MLCERRLNFDVGSLLVPQGIAALRNISDILSQFANSQFKVPIADVEVTVVKSELYLNQSVRVAARRRNFPKVANWKVTAL